MYDHFWPFFANCIVIFHKSEVQTVVLRRYNRSTFFWFRHYGLRCRWRPCTCLANSQKLAADKWPFYDHIWPFFCQLYVYLSQNWGSDGNFEVLNESKLSLVQKLWHKTQKCKKYKWVFLYKIAKNRKWKYLLFVS